MLTSSQNSAVHTRWLASFDDAVARAYEAAAVNVRILSLAGLRIRLEMIGRAVPAAILPAVSHALVSPDDGQGEPAPHATLVVWDGSETGITPPRPTWSTQGWAQGDLLTVTREGFIAAYQSEGTCFAMFAPTQRRLVAWIRDATNVPGYERAAPLRGPLSWLLSANGAQLAHAAAVATEGGAALLIGRGGSGKSTTAVLCLAAGLEYLGDDYVLLRTADARAEVHTLYATAKLTGRALDQLPQFKALIDSPATSSNKAVIQLAGIVPPKRMPPSRPISALILTSVGKARETTYKRAPAVLALKALAPTTLFQLPGAGAEALGRLAALVRNVPAYKMTLGSELDCIPAAVSAVIARS
jgi:hypothetical protein